MATYGEVVWLKTLKQHHEKEIIHADKTGSTPRKLRASRTWSRYFLNALVAE